MQADFYDATVCNRKADSRFWAVEADGVFVGMIGLAGIQWENRIGEISLVLDPAQHGKGYGEASLNLLLEQGFGNLNLLTICGECYECSPAIGFWKHMLPTYMTMLPKRKYWKGKHYNSMYFCFMREVSA